VAPRFPSSWVDQVYAAASIVELAQGYLPLQQRGRRHWGLCPFHNEKTASFSVNPELNLYYCFGCKASGNVVQFAMEMEKLSYPEALLYLAQRFNVPPPPVLEEDPLEEQRRSQRERLLEATREAALFYHEQLWLPENSDALDYLHGRGLDDATIRRFGLGASPDDWDRLLSHLSGKGYSLEELQLASLITLRESSRYDTFRHRVMFPIINRYGQPIGFGARALGDAQPKYLNSAESAIFNKRYHVYGINLLRRQRNLEQLILVEGYLDVISLSQAGIRNAVATLGTALTREQVRLIKNYAPEIWIAYDGDEAGQTAALRALDVLRAEMVPARVLRFPEGQDPDDLVRQAGAEGFRALRPLPDIAFRLHRLEGEHDLSQDEEKRRFAVAACQLLHLVSEPVEVDHYLGRISLKTGIAKDVLAQQARKGRQGQDLTAQAPSSAKARAEDFTQRNQSEFTLAALLASGKLPKDLVTVEDFEDSHIRSIAQALLLGRSPVSIMEDAADASLRALAGELFNRLPDLDEEGSLAAAEDCLRQIRVSRLGRRIEELRAELKAQNAEEQVITLQLIAQLREELNKQSSFQVH